MNDNTEVDKYNLFNELLNKYKDTLKSSKTKQNLSLYINDICTFTNKNFLDITNNDALCYLNHLNMLVSNKTYTKNTAAHRISSLRALSNFLMTNSVFYDLHYEFVFSGVFIDSNMFISPDRVPTPKQLDKILSACPDIQSHLILALVSKCGLTGNEICSLSTDSFIQDANGNYGIRFMRNIKPRYLKIPLDIVKIIDDYMNSFIPQNDHYLFHTSRNTQLTLRYIERLCKKISVSAGYDFTLQGLRNTAITYMLLGGAPDAKVCDYANFSPRWAFRFDNAVDELKGQQACDYSLLTFKPYSR